MGLQSLLYEALNVPMRALLRSPFHGIASRNLCLFIYTGRRSGRHFETPLSYVRDGSTIWLLSVETCVFRSGTEGAAEAAPVRQTIKCDLPEGASPSS